MKNIAIIVSSLTNGGAERAAGLLSQQLIGEYNVFIFTVSNLPITYEYGGTVVSLGMNDNYEKYEKKPLIGSVLSKYSYIRAVKDLKKLKRKYQIDISISFLETPNLMNIFSHENDKVIVSVRNNRSMQINTRIQRAENYGIRHFYNKVDGVVSVAYGVTEDLIENFGIKSRLITTINNFHDFNSIKKKAAEPMPDNMKILYKGKRVIFSMGRLVEQKNFSGLIQECHELFKTHKDIVLVIFGKGDLKESLLKLIKDLGEEDSMFIFDYADNPFPMLKTADIYVLNSNFEGICNSIVEAFACGTAVVSRDCKFGPREIIANMKEYKSRIENIKKYDKGILVSFDGKLSQAMAQILDDDEYRSDCVKNAFAYIDKYSNQLIKKQWIDLIERV